MNYELSPWFSGDTPPVRPGVYEREVFTLGERRFAYHDGRSSWALWGVSPEAAWKISNSRSSLCNTGRRWRGILNPSEV